MATSQDPPAYSAIGKDAVGAERQGNPSAYTLLLSDQRCPSASVQSPQRPTYNYRLGGTTRPNVLPDFNHDENDSEEHRGAPWSPMLQLLTTTLLRTGFLIQLCVMVAGLVVYYGRGGTGSFTFDLFSAPEHLRGDTVYNQVIIALQGCALVGVLNIAGFQVYLSDNSKETRGFRAGSKMLCTAATLDIFVVALRLMQHFYAFNFIGTRWWMRYVQTSADWCLLYTSALLHALAFTLYGLAIFYLDAYQQEPDTQSWGWFCFIAFLISGLFELLMVFTRFGALLPVAQMVALFMACFWACQFEHQIRLHAPSLHSIDINSNLFVADTDAT